ncbi:MAG TPA: DUF3108 domain-containing protein [Burkholderiaceae bacterium]|nr:DUF3108 domain-containing protein [Burkholderiaceae bacterium]
MTSAVATLAHPPLGFGRAILLILASLLLHAFVLSVMRDQLVVPTLDIEPPTRTIDAALIVEAPPAPPPPPPKRVAPKPRPRPKPAPPPPAAPPPAVIQFAIPEPPPDFAANDAPMPEAPGESEGTVSVTEIAAPPTPPPDPSLLVVKPVEAATPPGTTTGPDLAAEMRELGGASEALPTSGNYVYKLRDSRYAALTGTTTIEWRVDPDKQRYESKLRATVFGIQLAHLSSTGSIRRFGLAPERYVQKTGTRAPQAASLDWDKHIVTFSSRSFQRPAQDGMQDRLSFQFQLMAIGQRLPDAMREGATISMDVAGPGDVESYHFLVVGTETIETGAGSIEAIKLDRPKSPPAEARVEVWLAPSRGYLPIKLRFTDRRDNWTESLLESADESRQ